MKSTNYKKLSIANLKLNKNYGNKISKIKKESSISQRQMNNIKNKSSISLSTPKSNMITKKNKENNSPINFNILKYNTNKKISPSHYNVNNNYSEYITLKKKNGELKNEISNYKLKIKMIENDIKQLKDILNKRENENINDDTIKSLSITTTEDNIKK
jgi:hypothetical protein